MALCCIASGARARGRPLGVARTIQIRFVRAEEIERTVIRKLSLSIGSGVGFVRDPRKNTLTVCGEATEVARVERALRELDVPAQQVLIDAVVLVADARRAARAGFAPPTGSRSLGPFAATLGGRSLDAAAKELEAKGFASILATPRLLAVDGQLATLRVGDKIVLSRGHGRPPEERDTGYVIDALPHFLPDGRISLDMHVEMSGAGARIANAAAGAAPEMVRAATRTYGPPMLDGEQLLMGAIPTQGPRRGGRPWALFVLVTARTVKPQTAAGTAAPTSTAQHRPRI